MDGQLSPQAEEFLAHVVADGLFATKQAAMEAAVDALRKRTELIPLIPDEHMEAVERGIESANARRTSPFTPEFWDRLQQIARDAAAPKGADR